MKIDLTYTHNTRDLGNMIGKNGKKIKENRLIRSGALNKLSEKDIEILKKKSLKIVIDFRSEEEFTRKSDVRIEGVTYYNFPVLPKQNIQHSSNLNHEDANLLNLLNEKNGGKTLLLKTYHNMFISKEGIQAYQNFFKILMENEDGAILWHCSQGKDRAGMAAFLLEYALGVSLKDCFDDYYLTNVAMKDKIIELTPTALRLSKSPNVLNLLEEVFSAKEEYIFEALNMIQKHYQSIENFLINILHVDIDLLQKKYLI